MSEAKLNLNDPESIRQWSEKVARYDGFEPRQFQVIDDFGQSVYKHIWVNGEGQRLFLPEYHKALSRLFGVIEKIGRERKWGTEITHFVSESQGNGWTVSIGPYNYPIMPTVEAAVFTAICEYLATHSPE